MNAALTSKVYTMVLLLKVASGLIGHYLVLWQSVSCFGYVSSNEEYQNDNYELRRMKKEVAVTYFKALYSICLKDWQKLQNKLQKEVVVAYFKVLTAFALKEWEKLQKKPQSD
jgi:hypothetical protein